MHTYTVRLFDLLILLIVACSINTSSASNISYKVYQGELTDSLLQQLIQPSIDLFYDFPYLVASTKAYEEEFLRSISNPSMILVVAYDQDMLIGALLASAVEETSSLQELISNHQHHDLGKKLNIIEVMVTKAYQKQGIARQLLALCEENARLQGYVTAYLMTVMRSKDHPFKTADAVDIEAVWSHLGFKPAHLYEPFLWITRCGIPEREVHALADNMMQHWYKDL